MGNTITLLQRMMPSEPAAAREQAAREATDAANGQQELYPSSSDDYDDEDYEIIDGSKLPGLDMSMLEPIPVDPVEVEGGGVLPENLVLPEDVGRAVGGEQLPIVRGGVRAGAAGDHVVGGRGGVPQQAGAAVAAGGDQHVVGAPLPTGEDGFDHGQLDAHLDAQIRELERVMGLENGNVGEQLELSVRALSALAALPDDASEEDIRAAMEGGGESGAREREDEEDGEEDESEQQENYSQERMLVQQQGGAEDEEREGGGGESQEEGNGDRTAGAGSSSAEEEERKREMRNLLERRLNEEAEKTSEEILKKMTPEEQAYYRKELDSQIQRELRYGKIDDEFRSRNWENSWSSE